MRRVGRLVVVTILGAVAVLAAAPSAYASVREYWVAAVPATWNMIPNERDAIMGTSYDPSQSVLPTVVYRRYSRGWRMPERNVAAGSSNQDLIPGPLLRARAGDRLLVHFKNADTAYGRPHSMHFHGVHYRPSSDGTYLPAVSGRDARVMPGETYTYRLRAGSDSVGIWPYHDHSPSMDDSIGGGMYGMLSILGRHERAPDREFEVVFAAMGEGLPLARRAARPVGRVACCRRRRGRQPSGSAVVQPRARILLAPADPEGLRRPDRLRVAWDAAGRHPAMAVHVEGVVLGAHRQSSST